MGIAKTQETAPLVSVVVVTLNAIDLLRQCLTSLAQQDYPRLEIILVDNGSTQDIAKMLTNEFHTVRHIRVETNLGFAGGSNKGIRAATGAYIALINNDAAAAPQWISSMVNTAESADDIGAVGSIVIDGNNPSVLDSCGVRIALDGMSRQAMINCPVPDLTEPKEVLAISGCACLLKRFALDQIGLFDERFFAYCEDTDLCLRLRRAGWNIVIAPGAKVTHYYSQTAGSFSPEENILARKKSFLGCIQEFSGAVAALRSFRFRLAMRGSSVCDAPPSGAKQTCHFRSWRPFVGRHTSGSAICRTCRNARHDLAAHHTPPASPPQRFGNVPPAVPIQVVRL